MKRFFPPIRVSVLIKMEYMQWQQIWQTNHDVQNSGSDVHAVTFLYIKT